MGVRIGRGVVVGCQFAVGLYAGLPRFYHRIILFQNESFADQGIRVTTFASRSKTQTWMSKPTPGRYRPAQGCWCLAGCKGANRREYKQVGWAASTPEQYLPSSEDLSARGLLITVLPGPRCMAQLERRDTPRLCHYISKLAVCH